MMEFKVKAYGKSELAMLYFPDAGSAHTAVNHLMSWIHRNPELSEGLMKMGYRKSDKFFTPKQVAVIAEYLGEPSGKEGHSRGIAKAFLLRMSL